MTTEALLRDIIVELKKLNATMTATRASAAPAASADAAATDVELDGSWGDPVIKSDPKRWTGPSYVGCHFSESNPEYLDEVAKFKDWQASKDDQSGAVDGKGRPKSNWSKKEASLARGWAVRLRNGWKPAPRHQGENDASSSDSIDNEIPF